LAVRPWPSWLLLGPTGSGKTPLGEEIERRGLHGRRCVHFDFGANLRSIVADPGSWEMLKPAERESVRTSLATGALFEDGDMPLIMKIVERFAERRDLGPDSLLILNGLPRHRSQAEGLAGVVGVERVIRLEAAAAVVRERLRLDTGGDRAMRADDSLEGIERRLADFRERTLPLIDYFRQRGVQVLVIPVTVVMSAGEMFEIISRAG
jgi:adenylate kinase